MSYEGTTELLCANGHYFACDCYDTEPKKCPRCRAPWLYTHGVDKTNGYDPDDADSYPAHKAIIGSEDDWHVDHYGNRYATEERRFEPAPNSRWRKILQPR